MIWNIALVICLFSIPRKRISPYLAAVALGAIKFALYMLLAPARSAEFIVGAFIIGAMFVGLGCVFAWSIRRLDDEKAPQVVVDANGVPRSKSTFRWEYIPVTISVVLLIFGEMILSLLLAR